MIEERLSRRLEQAAAGAPIRVQIVLRGEDLPSDVLVRRARIQERRQRALAGLPPGAFAIGRRYRALSGFSGWADPDTVRALAAHPDVEQVYLDGTLHPQTSEGRSLVGADVLAAAGFGGAGIQIAVIDSGIDADHPELVDSVVAEQCFCDDDPAPGIGCCPGGGTEQSGPGAAHDEQGHGTAMAGVITSDHPSRPGVAPESGVVAIKVFGSEGASFSDVDAALDWVVEHHAVYGVRVVNLSLGDGFAYADANAFPCSGSATASAVQALLAAGVVVVAASGNEGHIDGVSFPACIPGVIAVGGVYDADFSTVGWQENGQTVCTDTPAVRGAFVCHSNSGNLLDLLAPDYATRTSGLGGSSTTVGGTSVASAYAAAQAALVASVQPALEPLQIRALLTQNGPWVTNPATGFSFRRTDVGAIYEQLAPSSEPGGGGPGGGVVVHLPATGPLASFGLSLALGGAAIFALSRRRGAREERR